MLNIMVMYILAYSFILPAYLYANLSLLCFYYFQDDTFSQLLLEFWGSSF